MQHGGLMAQKSGINSVPSALLCAGWRHPLLARGRVPLRRAGAGASAECDSAPWSHTPRGKHARKSMLWEEETLLSCTSLEATAGTGT